jgi:hypothetical protein
MLKAPEMQFVNAHTSMDSDEDADCVLFWALSKRTELAIKGSQLENLHNEVNQLTDLIGAKRLEANATHGMLRCTKTAGVSAADSAMRMGQLLCRWATLQEPELWLRVGVSVGQIQSIAIPGSGTLGYWGHAVSTARQLAESASRETCVHLRADTKESLRIFERVPFALGQDGTYFLEPWTEAYDEEGNAGSSMSFPPRSARAEGKQSFVRKDTPEAQQALARIQEMSVAEFSDFLESQDVDVSKFGRGQAKTMDDFFQDVTKKKKSYLQFAGGKIERRVELVRINLYAQGPDGLDRTLKIAMEILEDGRTRSRNQKIACAVPQGKTWKDAVVDAFKDRFGISEEAFAACVAIEGNWFKEEKVFSPSVPGVKTVYMTHEVRMRVGKDGEQQMSAIGLPGLTSFNTNHDGKTSHWCWKESNEEISHADMLTQLLQDHAISTTDFEPAAFQDLVEEVYETKMSTLTVSNGELLRHLQIIKIWIQAEVLSVPHVLVTKSKLQYGQRTSQKDRPISMRMSSGHAWQEAVKLALTQRMGLDPKLQQKHLVVDNHSYQLSEEIEYSRSYPGLKSVYRIHEVRLQVANPSDCFALGLPEGNDFVFSRQNDNNQDDLVVLQFGWKPVADVAQHDIASKLRTPNMRKAQHVYKRGIVDKAADFKEPAEKKPDPKRRVVAPKPMDVPDRRSWKSQYAVAEMMKTSKTDWDAAKRAAKRIRDPDYHLGMFFEDCKAAFPELQLYQVASTTSSGRSGDDEYQRTIGALFAVYWLLRLHLDGGKSFAYGVGDDWLSLSSNSEKPVRSDTELKNRESFSGNVKWPLFEEVLLSSGILKEGGKQGQRVHDEDRTLAMLVLTAIHDIMKVEDLLPTVDAKIGSFAGYKAGEQINDHDTALGYILEHVPDALPSYAGLPKAQQDPVKFTQCNMEYNMGWLVQAEAPPGPLFQKFRKIITSGGANPADISFYFVHWLTDLAGAEPCPLEGCEKFVLKFPQRVLSSFLSSFQIVQTLDTRNESEVYESYLKWRWTDHHPSLGPPPDGSGSLAQMRMSVMAQGNTSEVLADYNSLPQEERRILDMEFARTGCQGQGYVSDPLALAGPAFLVYYAPALLQKNSANNAFAALMVLAEVLKQARSMWPQEESAQGNHVIVRIDAVKEADLLTLPHLPAGEVWCLQRSNDKEALVKQMSLVSHDGSPNEVDWKTTRVLKFSVDRAPTPAVIVQHSSASPEMQVVKEEPAGAQAPRQEGEAREGLHENVLEELVAEPTALQPSCCGFFGRRDPQPQKSELVEQQPAGQQPLIN